MTTATLEKESQSLAKPTTTQPAKAAADQRTPAVVPRHRFDRKDEQLVFTAIMPGISAEALEIEVENERLTLKAQTPELGFEGYRKVYGEFGRNRYEASFKIPQQYDPSSIEAKLDAGILTLTMVPRETAKPVRIAVKGN
ncbi:Hsp20/alpha crystallin family protein [Acanthopleuribacter pedis]|uniref:Hsp20/alpha crystallin family protein n=1 Tax=Acanthopleuribacter pedis TaxID=442870 RepID=A0A8J7Q040_9BACT|nr:Hsp20/alpha crystallin family protein [Acanthopleuribacter pedis]MBO1317932.1 Hsp20/alpha crystallin family protein [Acanthopleuribacter pedis]